MKSPEELLKQGKYSQEELAQTLMDAHFVTVHHVAHSILRTIDDADDVAQDTSRYAPSAGIVLAPASRPAVSDNSQACAARRTGGAVRS